MNALPQIIESEKIPLAQTVVRPIVQLSVVDWFITHRLRMDRYKAWMPAPDYLLDEAGITRGLNESYTVGVVLRRIVKRKRA